mgnify:CR=1 FL=1
MFEYKNKSNNNFVESVEIKGQIYAILNIDANYLFLPKNAYDIIKEKYCND